MIDVATVHICHKIKPFALHDTKSLNPPLFICLEGVNF